MAALYHLDEAGLAKAQGEKQDLGPLPGTAVILLASLGAAWALIVLALIWQGARKRR